MKNSSEDHTASQPFYRRPTREFASMNEETELKIIADNSSLIRKTENTCTSASEI